jgi:hypothetical protein
LRVGGIVVFVFLLVVIIRVIGSIVMLVIVVIVDFVGIGAMAFVLSACWHAEELAVIVG